MKNLNVTPLTLASLYLKGQCIVYMKKALKLFKIYLCIYLFYYICIHNIYIIFSIRQVAGMPLKILPGKIFYSEKSFYLTSNPEILPVAR